jgi:hypothetical protein
MEDLENQWGFLSDVSCHFTPEYYAAQNWNTETDGEVRLNYFIADVKVMRREPIILGDTIRIFP